MRRRLQGLLEYADNLPSLPVAVIRALQLLNNEDSTTDAIVVALSADQALAAQLLRIANSPYYGVSRRVSTIKQAAMVLGRKAVKSLVIAAAAEDYLSRPQDGYLLDRGQLWQHSLVVAQASAMVAGRVQYRQTEEAFVAGLLHDIGKVVLNSYLRACREKVAARLNAPGAGSFSDLETELLSANHASIGGVVASHWQLPERLARAIEFQHAPSEAG
ncbi:MAG: HDOD domain-containing protein, partial [Armatimonadetes bacterium]|nr:HDOD domain-containing protein [Armatimonadota bacterium]